jgi:hypothetical protein
MAEITMIQALVYAVLVGLPASAVVVGYILLIQKAARNSRESSPAGFLLAVGGLLIVLLTVITLIGVVIPSILF